MIAITNTARITLNIISTSCWLAFSRMVIYFLDDSITTISVIPVSWVLVAEVVSVSVGDTCSLLDHVLDGVETTALSVFVTWPFPLVVIVDEVLGDFVSCLVNFEAVGLGVVRLSIGGTSVVVALTVVEP